MLERIAWCLGDGDPDGLEAGQEIIPPRGNLVSDAFFRGLKEGAGAVAQVFVPQ